MFILPREAGEGDRAVGAVEGATASTLLRRHANDGVSRFIEIGRQLGRRDAHDPHTLLRQPSITTFIPLWPTAHVMDHSINLDREFRLRTIEVEHVRSDRMLTTEGRPSGCAFAQSNP